MSQMSAVFYPFATQDSIDAIKFASIYFDKVYVLTPITLVNKKEFSEYYAELPQQLIEEFGSSLGLKYAPDDVFQHESVQTTLTFQQQAKQLINAGVIQVINPFDEMKNAGLENEFRRLIEIRVRDEVDKLDEDCRSVARRSRHGVLAEAQVGRRRLPTGGLLTARTDALSNIMYDAAILVGRRFNAIPITGDRELNAKFTKQITKGAKNREERMIMRDELGSIEKSFQLMTEAVDDKVPTFQQASYKEILYLRRHFGDELSAFRHEIQRLATSIKGDPQNYYETKWEIYDVIARDINPQLDRIYRSLKLSRSKWAKTLFEKVTALPTVASLLSSVVIGLPLEYGLLIAAGAAGIQTGFEAYFDIQEVKSSSNLTFLVEIHDRWGRYR